METDFFKELYAKCSGPKITKEYLRIDSGPLMSQRVDALLDILGLEENTLTDTARMTVNAFENGVKDESVSDDWTAFKWKLTAFVDIQDILDAPLKRGSYLNSFHLWYFYFESKQLLKEAVICGFSGLYSASNAVLRLLLEFNVLQNYYYRAVLGGDSYKPLEKYFQTRKHPNWNTVLKGCLPQNSFAKPIRFRLQMHLEALSENFSHPYHPDHSPRQHTRTALTPSVEGIYFWVGLGFLLDAILWTYYVNFPMLFHPKDTLNKFGFNAPVGLFIDEWTHFSIQKSLGRDEYNRFIKHSSSHDDVRSLTEWYDSFPDLSEAQIISSWDEEEDGQLRDLLTGRSIQKVKLRCMRRAMALRPVSEESENDEDWDIKLAFSYALWEEMMKRKKR
jgi:hypothetical protein